MAKIFKLKYTLIFSIGLSLGLFIFFPWNQLRGQLISMLQKQTHQRVQIESLEGGTGMGLGLRYGSLFGIHAKGFEINVMGANLHCDSLTLAPKMWPLLMGSIHLGFGCENQGETWLSGVFKIFPFWSPSKAQAVVRFKNFPLANSAAMLGMEGLDGNLFGDLEVHDLSLQGSNFPKLLEWDISAQKLILPSSSSAVFKFPSLNLGELTLKGEMNARNLSVSELNFGSERSPIKGKMKMNFGLDASMLPNSGEWSGELTTDDLFEKERLKDISLDLIFGKAKVPGKRRFVKRVKGSYLSLLSPPEEN
ncbi:MAG: hypothetical protein KA116_01775 [Proteobacteria bacterium]|nr:hypothetical protein [Pseudomonadota bacterium]